MTIKLCFKHQKVQNEYHGGKPYKYNGKKCDWCERSKKMEQRALKIEIGSRVRVVVTRDSHDIVDVNKAKEDVEKSYPGFDWKYAGCYMDIYAFSTMMDKQEMSDFGIDYT